MKICIPVGQDQGIKSPVSPHFGSAPFFLIVETDTGVCRAIANDNEPHEHGMCNPVSKLGGEKVSGVIVGGLGLGALQKFNAANVRVYVSDHATVDEAVKAFIAGTLPEATPKMTCGGHGGGCSHGH